jgi:hypothetical protein
MNQIKISSDALEDLNKGFLFYERQSLGLGDYFSFSLKSDIEELKISGGSHIKVFKDFHRSLSRIFPYGIFYTFSDMACTIWAVIDLRQDPEFITRHLKTNEPQQGDGSNE